MQNIILRTFCHAAALASTLSMPVLLSAQERTPAVGSTSTVDKATADLAALEEELNLVVFRSDSGDPREDCELILRNGQPVVIFTADGAMALSGEDIGSLEQSLLENNGRSSTYALYKDGEYMGFDIITEQLDEYSARLTFIDEAGNILSDGAIVIEKPLAGTGERQAQFFGAAIAYLGAIVTLAIWCLGRCDRCTDTCNAGNCDNNACNDCFGWQCS